MVKNSRSGGGEDTVADDLAVMGAPQGVINQFKQSHHKKKQCVYPENRDALNLFTQMDTQWLSRLITNGNGVTSITTGLNYTALESVMRMLEIKNKADVFSRIRIMEIAALEAMNQE